MSRSFSRYEGAKSHVRQVRSTGGILARLVRPGIGGGGSLRPRSARRLSLDEPIPGEGDPEAPRERHDAFTDGRKRAFLTFLVKSGCILDACRRVGVSPRTVYRHQQDSPAFFDNCTTALRMSATPVEITAWRRAVEGVEQEFACGGQIHVRRRYSDGLLRLLLQGSNPKKYGANPGFTRKRLLKHERKAMRREVRAELLSKENRNGPPERSFDEAVQSVLSKVAAIERHQAPQKLAAGWTKSEDGHWVPPGYAWVGLPEGAAMPGLALPGTGGLASDEVTPRDSV